MRSPTPSPIFYPHNRHWEVGVCRANAPRTPVTAATVATTHLTLGPQLAREAGAVTACVGQIRLSKAAPLTSARAGATLLWIHRGSKHQMPAGARGVTGVCSASGFVAPGGASVQKTSAAPSEEGREAAQLPRSRLVSQPRNPSSRTQKSVHTPRPRRERSCLLSQVSLLCAACAWPLLERQPASRPAARGSLSTGSTCVSRNLKPGTKPTGPVSASKPRRQLKSESLL